MNKIIFTNQVRNAILDIFDERAKSQGIKGKKFLNEQSTFILGAIAVIDLLNGNTDSCIPPDIYFSILRGNKLEKKE